MPRKLLHRSDLFPYHITARSNNREPFPVPMEKLWEVFVSECLYISMVYGVQFHAFTLMPNHIHAILSVPSHDLGIVMNIWMSNISRRANSLSGRSGHFFGGPYYWSIIETYRYYGHALKYVYRNPVRAGLSEKVENYPYTTLAGLLGYAHLPFPVFYTSIGLDAEIPFNNIYIFLDWLNRPFPAEVDKIIRKGLRKRRFSRPESVPTRKIYKPLENFL